MKKISIILCSLFTLIFTAGWSVPEDTSYIEVDCDFGEYTRIYFTDEDVPYLHVADMYVVNTRNVPIVGYALTGTEIYFDTFAVPYYYSNDVVTYLNITRVTSNHLNLVESNIVDENYSEYVIALLGALLFVSLIRRD